MKVPGWLGNLAAAFRTKSKRKNPLLCSECFSDEGLRIEAVRIGRSTNDPCPHCNSTSGLKLSDEMIREVAENFFRDGSFYKSEYGGASMLFLSDLDGADEILFPHWLQDDVRLIGEATDIGVRYYAPATWRLGEIQQLEDLKDPQTRGLAAADIVARFPRRNLAPETLFYRLRKQVLAGYENDPTQYDAPPSPGRTSGRLDSASVDVLYGSQDLEICIHECRVTKADECHLATLKTTKPLCLLNLCEQFEGDGEIPFESLYISVQLIFSAEEHSYDIAREIAVAANHAGLDGVIYPSYFSSLKGDVIPNIGLFGHPIAEGKLDVHSVNRLRLKTADYSFQLGPSIDS